MARIRSIKPTFFTNEDLADLSPIHRLCFIGLWTQADREGRLEDRPRRLKAAIFPYDDVDMEDLLAGLDRKGFITRYVIERIAYVAVNGFLKHQRPKSDEHISLIPAPLLDDPRGIVTAPRIGEGKKEGGEREIGGEDSAAAEAFRLAWNEGTSNPLPRCRDLTTKRRKHIRARLTEQPLAEWAVVIARIEASKFCRGEVPARREGEQPWVASIDWLIGSPDVRVKVLEGKYDNRAGAVARDRRLGPVYSGWIEECAELHNSTCTKQWDHGMRMKNEKAS